MHKRNMLNVMYMCSGPVSPEGDQLPCFIALALTFTRSWAQTFAANSPMPCQRSVGNRYIRPDTIIIRFMFFIIILVFMTNVYHLCT